MSSPLANLHLLFDVMEAGNTASTGAAFEAFRKRLAGSPGTRVLVDDGGGPEYQASSANVVRRLCTPPSGTVPGYGYTGAVEVYLLTADGGYPARLAAMLLLLPELVPVTGSPGTYRFGGDQGATVTFPELRRGATPPAQSVPLGFTGGAVEDMDYAKALNVEHFLRLQPYRSPAPHTIENADGSTVDLEKVALLGGAGFPQRAYRLSPPAPAWGAEQGQQSAIVEYLTGDALLDQADLCAVRGIRYPGECEIGTAGEVLAVTLAGYLARGLRPDTKPLVVVNLDAYEGDDQEFPQNTFAFVQDVLACRAHFPDDRSPVRRKASEQAFALLHSASRLQVLDYLPAREDNLARVQEAVNGWLLKAADKDPRRLLYVQLGRTAAPVAPILCDHVLTRSTLPPVFADQGSANLMMTTGKAYFLVDHVPLRRAGDANPGYPSGILSPNGTSAVAGRVQRVANWFNLQPKDWPLRGDSPTTAVPAFISTYLDQVRAKWGPYYDYFTGVRDFYGKPENDKLNMAVAYLDSTLPTQPPDTLAGLHQKFSAAAASGPVDFAAQLNPAGGIGKFTARLQSAFQGRLTIAGATVTRQPATGKITEVLVTGEGTLGPLGSPVTARFTQTGDGVVLDFRFATPLDWRPDGLPWIGFAAPFIGFLVADAGAGVAGLLGGRLRCGGVELDFSAPVPPTLRGAVFTADHVTGVSIDAFYQLVGGVSLVSVLPKPLDVVAALAVEHAEFGLTADGDPTSFAVDYFAFRLGWHDPAGWELLPRVLLKDLTIGLTVRDPGQARTVRGTITGRFAIGTGVVEVSVAAPELAYRGALVDGRIELTDLLALFLPGVTLAPPSPPAITQFSLDGTKATGDFTLSCALGFAWPIPSRDLPIIRLDGIGLLVDRATGVTTGTLTGSATLLPDDPDNALELTLEAAYLGAEKGWRFAGKTGGELSLTKLMRRYLDGFAPPDDYGITALALRAEPTTGSYEISGRTAQPWRVPFLDSLTIEAAMRLAYAKNAYSGELKATVHWCGMDLVLECRFGEQYVYLLDWGVLHAEVKQNEKKEWVATGSLRTVTLGKLVEDFISYATGSRYGLAAPWNLLESITLAKVNVTFNFTTKAVGFVVDVGPVNLGFCTIKSISVGYDADKGKVLIGLTGSFAWQQGDTLNWDATQPQQTPAPPGGGNQLLDLRLAALGQHVRVAGDLSTVRKVIEELRKLGPGDAPIAGPRGGVSFDPDCGWLVATNFGLIRIEETGGYTVELSAVFNDPVLYGLRVALTGPAAKVLAGLAFEVLYRRISDTVGVYQTELVLPEAMRTIELGAFSVTMPALGLAIYTNGDFQVDFGFPWNNDFSRSFAVSAIVPPGIPVLGAAGFYFGKLSSETSSKVPAATNGRFDPVIVFGLGVQVGVGKKVQYGPLKAGIAITVFGVVQGVLAKWHPNSRAGGDGAAGQLQEGYFFSLDGTFGIIGELYGAVDFAVIKASVDIKIKAYAQITYIAYHDIPVSVVAAVDARASLELDFGLFSITLHFSFSLTVKETFVIKNSGTAPWRVSSPLADAHRRRLRDAGRRALPAVSAVTELHWGNLAAAAEPQGLTCYLVPSVTVSADGARTAAEQAVCAVVLLAVESADPAVPRGPETEDSGFDLLARQVLRWVAAASLPVSGAPYSVAAVDAAVFSDDDLAAVTAVLADRATATPVPVDAICAFLAAQFRLDVSVPSGAGRVDAAPLPMPPPLALRMPAYGGAPALDYTFADFNTTSAGYLASLREYFADLSVQVGAEVGADLGGGDGESVGSFAFADYFRLIAQQACEAARDALRSYRYPLRAGESIGDVVAWATGAGATDFTAADLVEGNRDHPFSAGQAIPVRGAVVQAGATDTFTTLARATGDLVTARGLALANHDERDVLRPAAVLTGPDGQPYVVEPDDTLDKVAAHFGVDLPTLLDRAPGLLTQAGLLVAPSVLLLPDLVYPTTAGDTPAGVAARFGLPVAALANPALDAVRFDPATPLDLPHLGRLTLGALLDDITATNGLSRIGGMAGRYALHGLRLPTRGVTPAPAEPDLGLYALTGQQIPLPALEKDKPLTLSLVRPAGLTWVDFGGGDQLTVSIAHGAPDSLWPTITALQEFLASPDYRFAPPGTTVGVEPSYADQPTTYPTTGVTPWLSAGPVVLPHGAPPAGTREPRLWSLPGTLTGLADPLRYAPPRMRPVLGRYDEARGTLVESPIDCYGWATLVGFTVKRLPDVPACELLTVGEADIVLLERALAALDGSSAPVAGLTVVFPADAVAGAPAGLRSGAADAVTFGLLQANLTTTTAPPTLADAERAGNLTSPYDFLRLLWEGGITRSGGYYLYYEDDGHGLPDYLFNDKGEAALSVLVVWDTQSADRYVNTLATVAPFDTSSATVYAQSVPAVVDVSLVDGDNPSLDALAHRYYTRTTTIAEANPTAPLARGTTLRSARGDYLVTAADPGGDPARIAAHFGTTTADLERANPQITSWGPLPVGTALLLPALTLAVGTGAVGTDLAAIAGRYGTTVAALAADNATVAPLFAAGQKLRVPTGPTSRVPTTAPGCLGLAATRTPPAPPPPPADPGFARLYLQRQFSLLGYRLTGNAWFEATGLGLPISHDTPVPGATLADRARTPAALPEGEPWRFHRVVPVAANTTPPANTTLSANASPYAGVGGLAQPELFWVDPFGNRVVGELGDPAPARRTPMPVAYTDPLVGLSQWPGVAAAYRVLDTGSGPTLRFTASLDASAYSPPAAGPDDGAWREKARQAVPVYQRVGDQLAASPPPTVALVTALLPEVDLGFDADRRAVLVAWLVGTHGVLPFLVARAAGDRSAVPPAPLVVDFAFTADQVAPAQAVELSVVLRLARPAALVDPRFAGTSVGADDTVVAPAQAGDGTHSLVGFATAFEACLPGRKLASGVDRQEVGAGGGTARLWVLRVGDEGSGGFGFDVPAHVAPLVYAARPLYTSLQSRVDVPYYEYRTATGIDFGRPSGVRSFTGVDTDVWLRRLLAAVDAAFAPDLLVATALVTRLATTPLAWDERLREVKESLADALSRLVVPVFQDEAPDAGQLAAAQEEFRQQLLIALSNNYAITAVMQVMASVHADLGEAAHPPQLYGTFLPGQGSDPDMAVSAAKITLVDGVTPLTFTVTASGTGAGGAVRKNAVLDVTFRGASVEHRIGPLPGITDYLASSWLAFVLPPSTVDDRWPLDGKLPTCEVPLPLRAFPGPPTMVDQRAGKPPSARFAWADVLRWDYLVTYAEQFHYPQDDLHLTAAFNVAVSGSGALAGTADPVPDLAEFALVYPQVRTDLLDLVATVTESSDIERIDRAAVVLEAFVRLCERAAASLTAFTAGGAGAAPEASTRGQLPWQTVVTESSVIKDATEVLVVAARDAVPAGIDDPPVIDVPGYHAVPDTPPPGYRYAWTYRDADGTLLPAAKGQAIPDRVVTLAGLDIMAAQNATTTMWTERNRHLVAGRTTADAFVYRTAPAAFPTPLRPTVTVADPLDMAAIGGTGPVPRTLRGQWENLLATLFATAPEGPQLVQVSATYAIALNPALPAAATPSTPVLFLPPLACDPATTDLPAVVSAGVLAWFDATHPTPGGPLRFTFTVLTSSPGRDVPPSPLLVLDRLELAWRDWTDHPQH